MEPLEFELIEKKFTRHENILGQVLDLLNQIIDKETKIMAQIDDLTAAIAAEDVDVQLIAASATKIGTDVTTLLAKIAAGSTPTDLTAQIASINAHVAALKTASDQLTAADTQANA